MTGDSVVDAAMRLYPDVPRGRHGPTKGPLHRLALALDVGPSTVLKWARGAHPVPSWAIREIDRLLSASQTTTEQPPCPTTLSSPRASSNS